MTDPTHENQTAGTTDNEPTSPDQIRAEIEDTREQLGDTVEALAAKTDVKRQAHDRITSAKQTVTGSVAEAKKTITDKKDEFAAKASDATPESAATGARQLGSTVQNNPLPFATAGAFAAGLMIGRLLGRR